MKVVVIGRKAAEASVGVGVVAAEVVAGGALMKAGNAGTSGAGIGIEHDMMMNLGRDAVVVEADMETGSIVARPIKVGGIINQQVLPPHTISPRLLRRQLNL